MNYVRVVKPGVCATVQDLGRWHFQRFGVPVGGAMDMDAQVLANVLVGNSMDCATFEIAWYGSAFSLSEPALIALTGADLGATISDKPIPRYRPVYVQANSPICFRHSRNGCYSYLSIAGGLATPLVLGSRSTHVRSKLGGVEGRTVQVGDILPVGPLNSLNTALFKSVTSNRVAHGRKDDLPKSSKELPEPFVPATWFVDDRLLGEQPQPNRIRVVRGRHFGGMDEASQHRFWNSEFTVSPVSDRMGYRLNGPELRYETAAELASAGVVRGTIQLPPGGSPIALMADAATTGGYPNIAHVVSVDLGRLAQTQPGHSIRFAEVDLALAQQLISQRAEQLDHVVRGIGLRASGFTFVVDRSPG